MAQPGASRGTPSTERLRREALERDAAAAANRLAVQCQQWLRNIEGHRTWHCSSALRHYHQQLSAARNTLNQPAPPPPAKGVMAEIEESLAGVFGPDAHPATPPPAESGGEVDGCGGADAPLAHQPTWGDVLGSR